MELIWDLCMSPKFSLSRPEQQPDFLWLFLQPLRAREGKLFQLTTGIVFWVSLIDPTQTWECINSRPYLDSKVNLRSTKNGHFQLMQSLHQERDLSFWGNLAVCPPVKKLQLTQVFFAITFDIGIMKDQNLCSLHSLQVEHCQSLLEFQQNPEQ